MARGPFVSARQRILILNTEQAKPAQTIDQRGGDMDSRDIEKWRVKLDSYANVEDGVEYWLARDLMEPMGYTRWVNFAEVVKRAKVSC